jgi:anti-sigma factor RsiW
MVSDYIDGELDTSTASELEAHLARCPSCPPLAAALQAVLGQLRALPETVTGHDIIDRALAGFSTDVTTTQGESSCPS